MRNLGLPFFIAIALAFSACSKKAEMASPAAVRQAMPMAAPASQTAPEQSRAQPTETRRYIALRHRLEVEFPAAALQAAFDAALKRAEESGGEVLEANINRGTEYAPPSASLSLRLPPAAVDKFLAGLEQSGRVLRHQREAEDKTDAVIDAEARIANLTELRNRLRRMLAEKAAQVKDVIEIEKQLANTQASLDSIMGVRKALSKQTDLVAVQIEFRAEPSISERSFFGPIASAWDQAGNVLMVSAGGLITFIAAVLPWLVILVPVFWLARKAWRRWRVRRSPGRAGAG